MPPDGAELFSRLTRGRSSTEPMFLGESGQPWTNGLAGGQMREVRAQLRLGRDVVFHTLRHTYASYLVMAGAPLLAVMKLLGHSSLDQVIRYAHLSPDFITEAVLQHFPAMLAAPPVLAPAPAPTPPSGIAPRQWDSFTGHPVQRAGREWKGWRNTLAPWMRA